MNLSPAPSQYDGTNEQNMRLQIAAADLANFKKRQDLRLQNGERLILQSPDGSLFIVTVDNSGTLGTIAL